MVVLFRVSRGIGFIDHSDSVFCAHKSFGFTFTPTEVEVAHALLVADANGHAVIVANAAEKLFLYPGLNADLVP